MYGNAAVFANAGNVLLFDRYYEKSDYYIDSIN